MILEIRQVRDSVALDARGHARGSGRAERHAEVSAKRERAHQGVLIEIAKGVEGRYLESSPRSRVCGSTG
jgi:hypothetical protein